MSGNPLAGTSQSDAMALPVSPPILLPAPIPLGAPAGRTTPWGAFRAALVFLATVLQGRRIATAVTTTPWLQVLLLCLGQLLLWSTASTLLYSAPEIDGAEQFVWAASMEQGYWKHPPLPSWIMHGLVAAFGPFVSLPFIAAQACIVITLALTWRLACEFMPPQRAVAAMALTSLITYYNLGGDSFNHSVALLPFNAAALLMFYRATRHGGYRRWAWVGLFAGLSLLVKYLAILPLCGLLLYFALDRRLHRAEQFKGLALAAVIALLVVYPHVAWLRANEFMPLRYAHAVARPMATGMDTARSIFDFCTMQATRMLPFAMGLWYACGWRFGKPGTAATISAPTSTSGLATARLSKSDRLFLWVGALAPIGFTMLFGMLTQTELQSRWGTTCFGLLGLLVVGSPSGERCLTAGRAIRFAVAAQIVLCMALTLSKTVVAERYQHRTRANFPGQALAGEAHRTWREHSALPLRVAITDIWLGGNVMAHDRRQAGRPPVNVLIDGDPVKSPWVDMEMLESCGGLVIDARTLEAAAAADAATSSINAWMNRATARGTWTIDWARHAGPDTDGTTGKIRWGYIAPSGREPCPS